MSGWTRRFGARGVFWRQFAHLAATSLPFWAEPFVLAFWSGFFMFWGPARAGVMANLRAIKPGSSTIANFFRTYRVIWNFAWTMNDTLRFRSLRTVPDWEFGGLENFERLVAEPTGAIILTAHMGSYDLGAHVFSAVSGRRMHMVRAPEVDEQTQKYELEQSEKTRSEGLRVEFNTAASDLALELLDAVRSGEIVAIQGDRMAPGIAGHRAKLFGYGTEIPSGPFALAMTARIPIYPMFVIRVGRRRYRLEAFPPLRVERRSRQRDADLEAAVSTWTTQLESIIGTFWYQWFSFDAFYSKESAG